MIMRRILIANLCLVALLATGCGLAEDEVVLTPDAASEVVIDMTEFDFGGDVIEVTAGQTVTFVLVNAGANEHEFMIGRDVVETAEGYPNGFVHDFFETATPVVDPPSAGMDMGSMDMGDMDMGGDAEPSADGDHDEAPMDMDDEMGDSDVHAGFMVQRRPGEVARLTVTVPFDAVGEWEIGCFRGRGAHWDAGMHALLIVREA
jgi:uncharacterized cupredoxin-like copper-binding protein